MTNDFITLICPSCGGKLEITPNSTSVSCKNCGNEHLIRRDAGNISLEGYARCPICGRNDEVRKISSIVTSKVNNLSDKLQQPQKPIMYEPGGGCSRIIVLIFAVGFGIAAFFDKNGSSLIYAIASGFLFCLFFVLQTNHKNDMRRYRLALKQFANIEMPAWENAISRWKKTYYCFRDDCLFIPGENQPFEVTSLTDLLYKKSK